MASLSHMNMEVVSTNGVVLSLPQKAGMQSSLPLLQKNYKFSKVLFWGRLYGLTGDYLVAVGLEDSYTAKTFFYCMDGVSWAQLPGVTDEMKADCAKVEAVGRQLSGDISKVYTLPAEPLPDGEEGDPPAPKTITELELLACKIGTIDDECAMLPKGAVMKKPDGAVVDVTTFSGLDYSKATSTKSFVFLNQPKVLPAATDALTASTDFLETTDTLVPSGALCCKFDEAINCVNWRNLVWPGFYAYAMVGGPISGYCYFGTGEKNLDIAFMLP